MIILILSFLVAYLLFPPEAAKVAFREDNFSKSDGRGDDVDNSRVDGGGNDRSNEKGNGDDGIDDGSDGIRLGSTTRLVMAAEEFKTSVEKLNKMMHEKSRVNNEFLNNLFFVGAFIFFLADALNNDLGPRIPYKTEVGLSLSLIIFGWWIYFISNLEKNGEKNIKKAEEEYGVVTCYKLCRKLMRITSKEDMNYLYDIHSKVKNGVCSAEFDGEGEVRMCVRELTRAKFLDLFHNNMRDLILMDELGPYAYYARPQFVGGLSSCAGLSSCVDSNSAGRNLEWMRPSPSLDLSYSWRILSDEDEQSIIDDLMRDRQALKSRRSEIVERARQCGRISIINIVDVLTRGVAS